MACVRTYGLTFTRGLEGIRIIVDKGADIRVTAKGSNGTQFNGRSLSIGERY